MVNNYRNLEESSAFIFRVTRSKESELLGLRDDQEITTVFPRNIGNNLPADVTQHPRTLESSAKPLREPKQITLDLHSIHLKHISWLF
jgi:hypothetical protein